LSTASETIDESAEEAAPRPSLSMRAKRLLIAPLLLLRRLRRPKAAPESEESDEARPGARDARREESDEEAQAPAAPPLWRRLLPYGLVLLAGAAAGGGAIHWLSAQVIASQSAELDERQDEVARLKGVLAGYDKMVLQNHKKLEAEQGKRAEIENRLAIAQTDLTRRPPPGEARNTGGTQGPASNASGAGKTADCTLRPGSVGNTLKACLEKFNRQ
jgi:hypothetical protein